MSKIWCKILEVDGNQVLFRNRWNNDEDVYEMSVTIQAKDWVKDSAVAEISTCLQNENKAFTDEQFEKFASEPMARKLIENVMEYARIGSDTGMCPLIDDTPCSRSDEQVGDLMCDGCEHIGPQ